MGLMGRLMGRKTNNSQPEKSNDVDEFDDDENKKISLKERQSWQIILGDKDENEKDMSALRKKLGRTEQVRRELEPTEHKSRADPHPKTTLSVSLTALTRFISCSLARHIFIRRSTQYPM